MRLLRLIILDLTINDRILQQVVLINRRCRSAVERLTQTKFHSTIPSSSYEDKTAHSPWALHVHDLFFSQNMDVPKMVVSFILSIFLIQFKVRLFQNLYMSNLFISILALTFIFITLVFLFYWNVLYRICLKLMVKYNALLNWVLEILLFPAVIILRVFLSLLDPLYKVLLHIKPQVKFSLVQYFWNKKSKCFLSRLIATCLFVFHGIFFNLDTTHNLVLECKLHSAPVYLLTLAITLTISALPYPFLVASYVVLVMAQRESFDANSRHCLELPLLFPILYLCFGVLLSYPCAKMLELHHLGLLFNMVIRPKNVISDG